MKCSTLSLAAAGLLAAGAASAATQAVGLYNALGTVASTNGASSCGQVGFTVGATSDAVLFYPGAGKATMVIYSGSSALLQLCNKYSAIPNGGLNGFSSNATCTEYVGGNKIPVKGVNFAFTQTLADANSSIGSTTITIPAGAPLGAGCQATVATTTIRSGK